MKPFQIGDRVALSARFLRKIGLYGHECAQDRGTVMGVRKLAHCEHEHVKIKWDHNDDPLWAGAISCNLVHVGRLAVEAAMAEHFPA